MIESVPNPIVSASSSATDVPVPEEIGKKHFESLLPPNLEEQILHDFQRPHFYPPFSDRDAWKKAAITESGKREKERILRETEPILSAPVPILPIMDYIAFKMNGNRTDYESGYFLRRDNLGRLTAALCLTGDTEKYLPCLINHLWAIANERYWCMHAHAFYDEKDVLPPDAATRVHVDLFAASTAALVALTLDVAGEEIAKISPGIVEVVRNETIHRTISAFLNPENNSRHFWKNGKGNWAIWISDSLLTAGILLLDKTEDLARLIHELNRIAALYYANSPQDGFCEEGPSYWLKSGAEFFRYTECLERAFPGSMKQVYRDPKVRAVLEFPALMVMDPQ